MKVCTGCKQEKPLDQFTIHRATKDGLNHKCKECCNTTWAVWRSNNPELAKASHDAWKAKRDPQDKRNYDNGYHHKMKDDPQYLRTKKNGRLQVRYGITLAEYEQAIQDQDGRCPLCQKKKRLVVDHNHKTGEVRGFICQGCNVKLAALEDPEWLELAQAWIREM